MYLSRALYLRNTAVAVIEIDKNMLVNISPAAKVSFERKKVEIQLIVKWAPALVD
jgi:hypothetical protein